MFVLCSCDFCISLVSKLHLNKFQKCKGMRLLHGRSFIIHTIIQVRQIQFHCTCTVISPVAVTRTLNDLDDIEENRTSFIYSH